MRCVVSQAILEKGQTTEEEFFALIADKDLNPTEEAHLRRHLGLPHNKSLVSSSGCRARGPLIMALRKAFGPPEKPDLDWRFL